MDLTRPLAMFSALGVAALGTVLVAYGLQGQVPFAPLALTGADVAVLVLASLFPIGAAALLARAVTRTRLPWKLRLDPEPIDKYARVALSIGFVTVLAAAAASMAFAAATETAGWWPIGQIAQVAAWPEQRAALSARFALGLPIVAVALLSIPAFFKPRRLHGSARFGTLRDLVRAKLDSVCGVVLGRFAGRQLIYGGEGHVLGVAPSRSGKGVGWIIPTLLNWPGSVIVADPKQENFKATSGWRQQQGHKIFAFDPFSHQTNRWNPLEYVREKDGDPADEIDRVARILYPDSAKDSHWVDGARGAFRGTVAHLWESDRANLSLGLVARWGALNLVDDERLAELINDEARQPLALAEFAKLLATPVKERGSFLSTMATVLSPWLLPSIANATSVSDFDFRTLRKSRQAIHFFLSPDNASRSIGLQRIFWQQIIDALTRKLPGADEPWPVLILLDEFTLPGPLPLIMESAAFLAGYGVKLFLVVQSRHQLEATYDLPRTKALLDTMAVRVYYAPNDQTSAEQLSAELGTANFRVKSRSRSQGKWSVTYSDQRRPLMLPQEVMQLGVDAVLVLSENMVPIKGTKERYYLSNTYKKKAAIAPAAVGSATGAINTPEGAGEESQGGCQVLPRQMIVRDVLYSLIKSITTGADTRRAEEHLRSIYG